MLKTVSVEDYISHLKLGFLVSGATPEKVNVFDFINVVFSYVKEHELYTISKLFLFIDFYPFLLIKNCSSIASENLYPEDTERVHLSRFDVLRKVSLVDHILHGIMKLNELFRDISELGVYVKVGERRLHLEPQDYFYLLVSYLYHDVGKSPQVLNVLDFSFREYRKTDHAFASGEFLKLLRDEFKNHGIDIKDGTFEKIYLPVISHHQKPQDDLSALLKYIDHKAREYELRLFGLKTEFSEDSKKEEERTYETTPEEVREELSRYSQIPDKLYDAFCVGLLRKVLPQRRKTDSGTKLTYFHFPPNVYVSSFHVKYLLRYLMKKAGVALPEIEDTEPLTVARLVIKKAREKGHIKEEMFRRDLLAGWWYEVKLRNGEKKYFFGFPLYLKDLSSSDRFIVNVRALSSEEIKKLKEGKDAGKNV